MIDDEERYERANRSAAVRARNRRRLPPDSPEDPPDDPADYPPGYGRPCDHPGCPLVGTCRYRGVS